jgi:hypothetical protein
LLGTCLTSWFLASDYRPLDLEKEIREFWEKNHVRDKLVLL